MADSDNYRKVGPLMTRQELQPLLNNGDLVAKVMEGKGKKGLYHVGVFFRNQRGDAFVVHAPGNLEDGTNSLIRIDSLADMVGNSPCRVYNSIDRRHPVLLCPNSQTPF